MSRMFVFIACAHIFIVASNVSALKCYSCESSDKACLDTFDEDKGATVDCSQEIKECVKLITPDQSNDTSTIQRGCNEDTLAADCEANPDWCHTCDEDKCNLASTYVLSGVLLVTAVAASQICF